MRPIAGPETSDTTNLHRVAFQKSEVYNFLFGPAASVQLSATNVKQPSVTAGGLMIVFGRCRVTPSLVLAVLSSSAPDDASTAPYTGHTAPYRSLSIHYSLSVARRVQSGAVTVVMYSANK